MQRTGYFLTCALELSSELLSCAKKAPHPISWSRINLILSDPGNIILDVLSRCESQNITVIIIDNQGNLKESLGYK